MTRAALAMVALAVVAACAPAASERPTVSPQAATASPSASAQPSAAPTSEAEVAVEPIAFTTDDGVAIEGRLFGEGDDAVVLAHGTFESGQGSWAPYARRLSAEGYLVLTLNLRGFCPGGDLGCSGGERNPPENWRDVAAAVDYLHERGTATVFLMGASLGARAVLWAASRPGVSVAGVIGVSTPKKAGGAFSPGYDFTPEVIAAIEEPKLLIAGDQDEGIAAQGETLLGWATEPKYLTVLPTAAHGPDVLALPAANKAVLDFLTRYR